MANRTFLHTLCFSVVVMGLCALSACEDDSSGTTGSPDAASGGLLDGASDTQLKVDAATDVSALDATADALDPCAICSPNAHCLVGDDAGSAATDAGGICECNGGFEGDGKQCTGVAATVTGLRWELPCVASSSATVCSVGGFTTKTTTLGGITGAEYNLQLRFRGVVEQKTYTGGQVDGYWYIGGATNGDAYNVYKLEISSPPQTYFVNAGTSNIERSWAIDYSRTIRVKAGATLTLSADAVDGAEIKNIDNTQGGVPIVIPDVAPAPASYNGQFVQMDVLSVTRLNDQ